MSVNLPTSVPGSTALPRALEDASNAYTRVAGCTPDASRAEEHADHHKHKHAKNFHDWALRHSPHTSRLPRILRKPPPPRRPIATAAQTWGGDEGGMDSLAPPQTSLDENKVRRIESVDTQTDLYDGEPSDSSAERRNWPRPGQEALEASPTSAATPLMPSATASPSLVDIDNVRAALALLGCTGQSQAAGQSEEGAHAGSALVEAMCARLADSLGCDRSDLRLAQVKEALIANRSLLKAIERSGNPASDNRYLLLPLILLNAARPRTRAQSAIALDRQSLLARTVEWGAT